MLLAVRSNRGCWALRFLVDGVLAASTQRRAAIGAGNARAASRALGVLVIVFSFGLGGGQLAGLPIDRFALPLGIVLFAIVIAIRICSRYPAAAEKALPEHCERLAG